MRWTSHVFPFWKTWIVILTPLLALPLLFVTEERVMERRCAYVVLIMAIFWMTEAVPMAVTSLIPVFLFPLLGVLSTSDVCMTYFKETSMMFIGSLMVAIAVEHCNLHKRIALRVLLWLGASQKWLMLGFMLTTTFLSMWISNTATTAMMVPIVDAVLSELYRKEDGIEEGNGSPREGRQGVNLQERQISIESPKSVREMKEQMDPNTEDDDSKFKEGFNNARIHILLAVAFSANIGGTGTITGTTTNLIFKAIMDELYGSDTGLNYGSWIAFNVPGLLLNGLIAWLWLQGIFLFSQRGQRRNPLGKGETSGSRAAQEDEAARAVIKKKYVELGPMSFHEFMTLTLFVILVLLWLSRDPQFITGWAGLIEGDGGLEIGDGTAAMLIVFLFFIIPAKPNFWCFRESSDSPSKSSAALLNWRVLHEKVPWGLVLLIGGGFAVAKASETSCLSHWLGQQMGSLKSLPTAVLVFIMTFVTAMISNVASNTATATIITPVLAQLAFAVKVNPLYLMLPSAVACSYAFMLPVANPPNAIVFEASQMKTSTMVKAGFVLNVICVGVVNLMINTFGRYLFDFSQFPDWANTASHSNSSSCT